MHGRENCLHTIKYLNPTLFRIDDKIQFPNPMCDNSDQNHFRIIFVSAFDGGQFRWQTIEMIYITGAESARGQLDKYLISSRTSPNTGAQRTREVHQNQD